MTRKGDDDGGQNRDEEDLRLDTHTLCLKIVLRGTKPPIWRRLLIPDSMTLADLHEAILVVMKWNGGHLHVFDIDGTQYGDPATTDDVQPQHRRTLRSIRAAGASRFTYTYDFGDDWQHVITIEKTPATAGDVTRPCCIGGKRASPPDDCGGVWGYQELLEILADPAHPDREERLEWLGDPLEPEVFDLAEANTVLAALFP